jgi:adenylosuccinate synthase
MEEVFLESIEALRKFKMVDSEHYLHQAQKEGKKILAEGAQGSLLDVDFGTYPFVTSSTTTAAGACTGLGIAPNKIKEVFGIFKAYATRVGSGPFPTELFDQDGETMGRVGNEFGATTGRSRRCGWLDLVALKYSIKINGVTQLMMMKGDVLSGFKKIRVCTAYQTSEGLQDYLPYDISDKDIQPVYETLDGWEEDLTQMTDVTQFPKNFLHYIEYLEEALETPIKIVSVGPDRAQTIYR